MGTAVGVSWVAPGWCLVLTQLQKPELAATGALWLCWGWGETQAAGVSDSKYLWGESWRDYRGSTAAVLAVGLIHGRICWVCYRGSLWTVISPASCLLIIPSAFLPCSKLAQYVSALPICVRFLCSAPWGWGSQVVHLILRFLTKGALSWDVLSWCWTVPFWGIGWSRQSSHLPFFLVHLSSGLLAYLFHSVAKPS